MSSNRLSQSQSATLKNWFLSHLEHPYLSTLDRAQLTQATGATEAQVNNFLYNARKRYKARRLSPKLTVWHYKLPSPHFCTAPPIASNTNTQLISSSSQTSTPTLPDNVANSRVFWMQYNNTQNSAPISKITPTQEKILREWVHHHLDRPYPNKIESNRLMKENAISKAQLQYYLLKLRRKERVKRRLPSFPRKVVKRLEKNQRAQLHNWFMEHSHWPYPTQKEKLLLAKESGVTLAQVTTFLQNMRKRHKEKIEDASTVTAAAEKPKLRISIQELLNNNS